MLGWRRRRWANIEPKMNQCLLFAERAGFFHILCVCFATQHHTLYKIITQAYPDIIYSMLVLFLREMSNIWHQRVRIVLFCRLKVSHFARYWPFQCVRCFKMFQKWFFSQNIWPQYTYSATTTAITVTGQLFICIFHSFEAVNCVSNEWKISKINVFCEHFTSETIGAILFSNFFPAITFHLNPHGIDQYKFTKCWPNIDPVLGEI